jgi:nicotinate-nucleotide adenylyltransferase
MHIARLALTRLKLHAVWWIVSPGNPLKTKNAVPDFMQRVAKTKAFVKHPRMAVTAIESELKTRYTHDTLKALTTLFPRTDFVWIAGMDNACAFHKWDHWADLPHIVPFVFFDRPPQSAKIKGNRIRNIKGLRQRTKTIARALKPDENGVFWMLHGKALNISSTQIRQKK